MLESIVRKEPVFPMTMSAGQAISQLSKISLELNNSSQTSALISDETGDFVGLITLSQLYRELIRNHPENITVKRDFITSIEFQAQTSIREIEEKLSIDLPSSRHYQTIGGFITETLGKIPETKEFVDFENWRFIVVSGNNKKISKILAKKIR